jgi:small subunit ribosomal protein S2
VIILVTLYLEAYVVDLKEMLEAGVHFGHRTSRWHPKMQLYVWGARNKIHLIDISKTAFLLEKACKYIKQKAADGGVFLWVGTKKPAKDIIESVGKKLSMPYVKHRWIGGTLSNFDQIKKAITRFLHLNDVVSKDAGYYTKKEMVMINKDIERLERNIGGIVGLKYPPAAVIVVDAKRERATVKEASKLGIPVIALVDTNTDPDGVNFVLPGNDDSEKSIKFIVDVLVKSIEEGVAIFSKSGKKAKEEEKASFGKGDKNFASKEDKKTSSEKSKLGSEVKKIMTKKTSLAMAEEKSKVVEKTVKTSASTMKNKIKKKT